MKVTTLGIDLAKSIFRLHGVDTPGVAVLRRQLTRKQLLPFLAKLSPCLVGMEAGSGAHFWAREIGKLGHEARLMSPHFVKPYIKSNKNDANDAEAICEAVGRPSMRFVPSKSTLQQDVQGLHRIRARRPREQTRRPVPGDAGGDGGAPAASGRRDSGVRPASGAGLWPGRTLPTSGPGRRGRAAGRDSTGRGGGQRARVQERSGTERLVGPGAAAALQRGQDSFARNQQTRRPLFANAPHLWCTLGAAHCGKPKRST
jgi:hypothetical protein